MINSAFNHWGCGVDYRWSRMTWRQVLGWTGPPSKASSGGGFCFQSGLVGRIRRSGGHELARRERSQKPILTRYVATWGEGRITTRLTTSARELAGGDTRRRSTVLPRRRK